MESLDQLQIIQEIVSKAISKAQHGWSELIINYHVETAKASLQTAI